MFGDQLHLGKGDSLGALADNLDVCKAFGRLFLLWNLMAPFAQQQLNEYNISFASSITELHLFSTVMNMAEDLRSGCVNYVSCF